MLQLLSVFADQLAIDTHDDGVPAFPGRESHMPSIALGCRFIHP